MDRWEYKLIELKVSPWPGNKPDRSSWEEKLNAAGKDGWEAVGAPSAMNVLMKRRVS
ncbi:MAG: DUF4177 domain-containing protein [Actinomycetota bacterium]|nr:DUF4177 domain-containing protein [Actinomycetota bacterium]